MGNSKIGSYKGSVNSNSLSSQVFAARREFVRALLLVSALVCALSCADADSGHGAPGSQAGASSAGGNGTPGGAAGESGSPEAAGEGGGSSQDPAAGEGGRPSAGSTGAGGHAGQPIPGRCFDDAECNDGLYCNGIEYCKTLSPDSDVKVCMGPEHGPCDPSDCNEDTDTCRCDDGDHDGDGVYVEGCAKDSRIDCDDNDSDRFPGNPERCDALQHDEDCRDSTVGVRDVDGDGFTDEACANKLFYQPLLSTPQPLTAHGTDCHDDDAFTHPGAIEVCDNKDNNCNGETDEVSGAPGDAHTYYQDRDGDQYGSTEHPLDTLCNFPPPGYAVLNNDCDDTNGRINPGREEICDGADNDCNGSVDQPEKPGDLMFGQPYDGITEFECTGIGGWRVKTCPSARLDCNASPLDACETIASTLCNCRVCGTSCSFSCGETTCEELALVSTGTYHTCAMARPAGSAPGGGTAVCWGRNIYGQLGNSDTKDEVQPIRVPGLKNVTSVASGGLHSCAIAGNQRLFCWGSNDVGQLGASIHDPVSTHPVEIYQPAPKFKVRQVSSGLSHTCAIFEDGHLVCWGEGASGKLGNNHTDNRFGPERVQRIVDGNLQFVNDASQVVAGDEHTCLLSGGRVECWGDNSSQQLGIDPDVLDSSPVARPVPGLEGVHVDELSAAYYHTCARVGGDVYCWGSNLDHELALESGDSGAPTKIPLPAPALSIATGNAFGCALGNGKIYCWGSNYFGERGIADDPPPVLPTPISLSDVTGIFAGRGSYVCAAKGDASVSCWGNNDFGELGNGDASSLPHPAPSRVLALTGSQVCLSAN